MIWVLTVSTGLAHNECVNHVLTPPPSTMFLSQQQAVVCQLTSPDKMRWGDFSVPIHCEQDDIDVAFNKYVLQLYKQ